MRPLVIEPKPISIFFSGPNSWQVIYDPQNIACQAEIPVIQKIEGLKLFIKEQLLQKGCIINLSEDSLSELWQIPEVTTIIHFSCKEGLAFDYINNPDQTIRWFYPTASRKAPYLQLFNGSGWKNKLKATGARLLSKLGINAPIRDGQFHVQIKDNAYIHKYLKECNPVNYAVFTGTKGINRKIVVALSRHKKADFFLKIPLTKAAEELLVNEHKQLTVLNRLPLRQMIIPKLQPTSDVFIKISNVKPTKAKNSILLTDVHLKALEELYTQTATTHSLHDHKRNIEKHLINLASLEPSNGLDTAIVQAVKPMLMMLYQKLKNTNVIFALAHGDFTPWNTYLNQQNIHTYDWELSEDLPILYDAFHYIFQSGVLIQKLSFTELQQQIDQLSQHSIVQSLLKEHNTNFEQCYQLYLLHVISYYLPRYILQDMLHEQANWLLKRWYESLSLLKHSRSDVYPSSIPGDC